MQHSPGPLAEVEHTQSLLQAQTLGKGRRGVMGRSGKKRENEGEGEKGGVVSYMKQKSGYATELEYANISKICKSLLQQIPNVVFYEPTVTLETLAG